MANANEFVITEHRCEMCKSYAPAAECTMNIEGKVIARFWLCIGCQKEMKETYKDVLNKPLTAQQGKGTERGQTTKTRKTDPTSVSWKGCSAT